MAQESVRFIDLPRILDARGNLTFIEGGVHVPFDVKRIFYLYDVPGGADRAGHALKSCYQFVVAASGSFDVHLDDGATTGKYSLNRSYNGLLIPPMMWRVLDNFSSGSVCLVLASEPYDEQGYWRDYDEFVDAARALRGGE